MIIATASPILAAAGIFLLALFVYGMVKRLFKMAVFFGVLAAVAWVWFFGG